MSARPTAAPALASPLARLGFACLAFLIAYASLYPLAGWRDSGIAPYAYLFAPWPRYHTGFDVATNVLAYLPLGMLGVLAVHPRLRGVTAMVVATASCAALSAAMEALQTYLPHRVASNVDLALNAGGALIGAAMAAPFATRLIERSRLRDLRLRLFEQRASFGLLLVLLWFVAQLFPQAMLFGTGAVMPLVRELVDAVAGEPVRWGMFDEFAPEGLVVAEAATSASALAGAAALLLTLTRVQAPRVVLLTAFVLAAIGVRSFAAAVAFGIDDALVWTTPGARLGLAAGFVLALACAFTPAGVRRMFALGLLTAATVIVNLLPENPYFMETMTGWQHGQWINFDGLLQLVATAWPYLAIAHLLTKKTAGRRL